MILFAPIRFDQCKIGPFDEDKIKKEIIINNGNKIIKIIEDRILLNILNVVTCINKLLI
mgnify:CR=1 FL=1|tara:strand:- start:181 stop:357 length:177 start_codon:yes stop_codon:yes gene_type:complete